LRIKVIRQRLIPSSGRSKAGTCVCVQAQPADEAVAAAADASAAAGADGVAACGAAEPAPTWPKNFAQFHFSELALAAGDLNVRLRLSCLTRVFCPSVLAVPASALREHALAALSRASAALVAVGDLLEVLRSNSLDARMLGHCQPLP